MFCAVIGIVHDDDVPIGKIALEFCQHRGHRFRYRAEMLRDGLGLRHHLAVAGAKGRGKVHDVLDDLGTRDPDHGVGHVVRDRIQTALDDRKGDRIDLHASNSRTIQPIPSLCALASGGTTMVASNSSMISGPWRGAQPSALRSTILTATAASPRAKEICRVPVRDDPARAAIFMLPKSRRLSRRPRPATRTFISSIGVESR